MKLISMNKRAAHAPLHVNIPNGTTIQSSHTSELLLRAFPPQARRAHTLSRLVHNSLIYVRQLCDSGCDSRYDVTITLDKVEVSKDRKSVMSGLRDQQSLLWRVDSYNHAHETINVKELINYVHATAFSPVK
jgi:hypothetical protein